MYPAFFLLLVWLASPNSPVVPVLPSLVAEARAEEGRTKVTAEEFGREVQDRVRRVPEFRAVAEEAEKMGVRVWLFGGTASGFGHYVNWDLQREKGDQRFQADRFDYDFTNIYRSSQDADIVVDGTPEQAKKLQEILKTRFPYLKGSKEVWEVRTLKTDLNSDKLALLHNPDFINQHTDSNSTGMIEITAPPEGESALRDLKSWDTKEESLFARDLREGKLTYLFSPSHEETSRFLAGKNPPILSAVRALIKAFQYDLEIRPEDWQKIQKVVDDFDPQSVKGNSYVVHWLDENGKKLVTSAVDMENAWNTLEKLGLRQKLIDLHGDPQVERSLAWWMSKEPLRSLPLGAGSGKTAKELGLSTLAHGTSDFSAYESITMSRQGEPNIFISREGASGEAAVYGNGLYTRPGTEGAGKSGFTIRFALDPNAREGSDFKIVQDAGHVIVLNKNAVRVMPETSSLDPAQWFEMLEKGNVFRKEDQGTYEKLRRRTYNRAFNLSDEQDRAISRIVERAVNTPRAGADGVLTAKEVLKAWVSLPVPLRNLKMSPKMKFTALLTIAGNDAWGHPELEKFKSFFGDKELTKSQQKALAEFMRKTLPKKPYKAFLIPWGTLAKENPYWKIDDWIEVMKLRAFDLHWSPEVMEDIFASEYGKLSESERGRVAQKIKNIFLRHEAKGSLLKTVWNKTQQLHRGWGARDWLEVLSKGNYLDDNWADMAGFGATEMALFDDAVRKAPPGERKEALDYAAKLLAERKGNNYFSRLWLRSALSSEHQDVTRAVVRNVKALTEKEITALASGPQAQPQIWEDILPQLNKKQLKDFYQALYYRDTFGDSPPHADLKRKLLLPIVRRFYELGEPESLNSVAYKFRESWTKDWGPTLTELIEEMARHKDTQNLAHLTHYLGIFDQPQISAWEDQAKLIINRAAELNDRQTLLNAAQDLISGGGENGQREFGEALSLLIRRAEELQDKAVLRALASRAFKGPRAVKWKPQIQELMAAAERLKDIRILEELAGNLTTAWYVNEKEGNAFEPEMRQIMEKARKSRSKKLIQSLAWTLGKGDYAEDFLLDYLSLVEKTKDKTALDRITGVSGWFYGYKADEVKSLKQLQRALDLVFSEGDPDLLHYIFEYSITDRPAEIKEKYLPAAQRWVDHLLALGASDNPADRELYKKVRKKMGAPNLIRSFDKGAPELASYKKLEELLAEPDPRKAVTEFRRAFPVKIPAGCAAGFNKLVN